MATLKVLWQTVGAHRKRMCLWGLCLALGWQVLMLLALMLRFKAPPNYADWHNWPANVWTIIQSTPSWSDMPPIIKEEWLFEVGRMNYDYGIGISEWSLNVIPSRLLMLFVAGALCALLYSLLKQSGCSSLTRTATSTSGGIALFLIAMTNATMSWVVCCATPTWVVGLAMLGLGVSTSLALESLGSSIAISGFSILVAFIVFTAWKQGGKTRLKRENRNKGDEAFDSASALPRYNNTNSILQSRVEHHA